MSKQPYKYWNRGQMLEHLIPQCIDFDISTFLVKEICYDSRWNPKRDFNGCSVVQDELHPFVPCFIHDYRWVVGEGGLRSDIEFRRNLILAGFSKFKAYKYFIAVRIGWLFYYKWKNR